MGIWDLFKGKPEESEREHKYLKNVGRGYQGKHYEEQPPANVQYEQLGDKDTYWLNDDDTQ
jgi:hypothetical protein